MKKLFTLAFVLAAFGFQAKAQCPANDSTQMGSGTGNDVFYSLENGTVTTISNTNWHMAFSVQEFTTPQTAALSAAVRVNSGGNGTIVKRLDNANPANWRAIDTTGLSAMPQLLDSDSTWNLSAFTSGYKVSSPFDFKWGTYDQNTHHITGTKVYVIQNTAAGFYKKVFVSKLHYDTVWNVIISNIDNSDSVYLTINKRDYTGKMFVYYNASTNQVLDREPAMSSWDLLWTKYVTWVTSPQGSGYYPVAGVLSHPKVKVEQNNGKTCNMVWLHTKTSVVDPRISAIGHDWKTFTGTAYVITDTFVYFVRAQDSAMYKLTFLSYAGGPLGKSVFNVYEATLGIDKINAAKLRIFPNPNSGVFSVESEVPVQHISIVDMQGKTVYSSDTAGKMDVSGLADGIYIVKVHTTAGVYHQQIIKE